MAYDIEGRLTFYEKIVRYIYNHFGDYLTDEQLIRARFRVIFHRPISLRHPRTFYEKIQWLKLHDRQPIYHQMADKYGMRSFCADIIGEEYLVPLIGHWNSTSELDVDSLPDEFALKCTHDSQSAVICHDKSQIDWPTALDNLEKSLHQDYSRFGREWAYSGLKPALIAEQLLVDETGHDLKDYKVFCFGGVPKFIQVDYDRFVDHKRRFYDTDWQFMENTKITYPDDESYDIPRPWCLEEMLKLSAKLSEGRAFLRVDWYVTKEKLYIGELTFYPGCGFEPIEPATLDEKWGEWIKLP